MESETFEFNKDVFNEKLKKVLHCLVSFVLTESNIQRTYIVILLHDKG